MTLSPAGRNPYVGLRPFEKEDSLWFFGRREQTAELLERLHENRFLAVVGSSGCGKSSLIRASLIPSLLGGFLVDERDEWMIAVMKPGDSPARNLATALCAAAGSSRPEDVASLLRDIDQEQADAIVSYLLPKLGSDTTLLLLVDQFEEIFAFRGTEDDEQLTRLSPATRRERGARRTEAANFVDLILSLPRISELPVCVVLTMRSDFLGDCDEFYGLPEAMNRSRYLVPRLTRQQLREAVQGPAMLSGVPVAPRLLDTVLNEVGGRGDQLPVLQHALFRTWNAWHADQAGPLDLTHYERVGGLNDALSQHAQEALRADDLDVTAKIFKCLTDTDPNRRRVRRPAPLRELAAVSGIDKVSVRAIVERFRDDGRNFLVVSDDRDGDARIDISHESLIRQWAQLRVWIDQEGASREQYRDLVKRARGERALLPEADLSLALKWRAETSPTPAWAMRYSEQEDDFSKAIGYLDRSQQAVVDAEKQRKRFQNSLRAAVVAVMIVLAGLAGWAWIERRAAVQAEEAARRAEENANNAHRQADEYASLNDERLEQLQTAEEKLRKLLGAKDPVEVPPPTTSPAPVKPTLPALALDATPTLAALDGRQIVYNDVRLNGQGNAISVGPGEKFTISFSWTGRTGSPTKEFNCPGCIVQLYYGIDHRAGGESKCFVSDIMGPGWARNDEVKGILTAPTRNGTFYITQGMTLEYNCEPEKVNQSADQKNAIAAVTVK